MSASELVTVVGELLGGGLTVVTVMPDGKIGARLLVQLDGDVVSTVSSAFLADADAQRRHEEAIAKTLGMLAGVQSGSRALWMGAAASAIAAAGLALTRHWMAALIAISAAGLSHAFWWFLRSQARRALARAINYETRRLFS
jgi:hypothetical protein